MRPRLLLGLVFVAGCGDNGRCAADVQCGAHEYCNTASLAGPVCECVHGYTDSASGCSFSGLITDPGFTDPTKWSVTNGALVDPTAPGEVDVGEVEFATAALCGYGTVEQDVAVPPGDRADPMVVEVSLSNPDLPDSGIDAGLAFDDRWIDIPPDGSGFRTIRMCLGEAGYAPSGHGKGDTVRLKLGPLFPAQDCSRSFKHLSFDHVEVKLANEGECPAPGQAINGDAETTGGWTFTTATGSSSGALVAGAGAGGTTAARLTLGQRCDLASVANSVSVPRTGSPALEFFYSATAGAVVFGSIDMRPRPLPLLSLSLPLPTETGSTVRYCVPPIFKGTVIPVRLLIKSASGGLCTDQLNLSVNVDNLRVVDDPTCGTDPVFGEPGFESATNRLLGSDAPPRTDAVVSSTAPHTGKGVLDLFSGAACTEAQYLALPIVPRAQGAAGPAFKFFYRIPGIHPNSVTTVSATSSVALGEDSPGWVAQTVCLDPKAAGHPILLSIFNTDNILFVPCGTENAPEHAYFDDFSVGTDPSCPAL